MKNKFLLGIVILLLAILVACSQEKKVEEQKNQTPEPSKGVISVNVTEKIIVDPCKEIKCKENENCKEGKCVCSENSKQCKESCIPNEKCCTSLDCQSREECVEQKCKQTKFCDYNQHFDETKNECACNDKTKWCKEQNKCIKYDACCDEINCNPVGSITRLCKKTVFLPTVCVKSETGQHCVIVSEGGRESFTILKEDEKIYGDVYVDKVYENGASDIRVKYNSTTEKIEKLNLNEERKALEKFTAKILEVDMRGGNCREDKNSE